MQKINQDFLIIKSIVRQKMTRKIDILKRFKIVALTVLTLGASGGLLAQNSVEWLTLGNDFAHTRYSTADENYV